METQYQYRESLSRLDNEWLKSGRTLSISLEEVIKMSKGDVRSQNIGEIITNTTTYKNWLAALESKFVPLAGSEKQIKWATDLRQAAMQAQLFNLLYSAFQAGTTTSERAEKFGYPVFRSDAFAKVWQAICNKSRQSSAKYWIDNK